MEGGSLLQGIFAIQSAGGGNFPIGPSTCLTSPLVTAKAKPEVLPFSAAVRKKQLA